MFRETDRHNITTSPMESVYLVMDSAKACHIQPHTGTLLRLQLGAFSIPNAPKIGPTRNGFRAIRMSSRRASFLTPKTHRKL